MGLGSGMGLGSLCVSLFPSGTNNFATALTDKSGLGAVISIPAWRLGGGGGFSRLAWDQ